MPMFEQPNPGSAEAQKLGCTCPVLDNHYGRGVASGFGEDSFWITDGCPLHAPHPTTSGDTDV